MVKLKIGYASAGDVRTFSNLLNSLAVTFSEENGYITTDYVTSYQRSVIEDKADDLIVPCVVIGTKPEEPSEYKEKYEALLEEYTNFKSYVKTIYDELGGLLK